jgi:hypothetical protein
MVGCPVQIISDHGSDLEKGIKLYIQKFTSVIYTYDVTHAMALILKHELATSEKYQSFIQKCNQCRHQLQQTELSFISPPSQRSQCRFLQSWAGRKPTPPTLRYFNVEKLINWAQTLLNCPIDTLFELSSNSDQEALNQILIMKFGWLGEYIEDISIWGQMVLMTRTLEKQLKINGINQHSNIEFELQECSTVKNVNSDFQNSILEYITNESSQIPVGKTFLATSDVIESIFGKYKNLSSKSPIKQIGQMVLNISLCTMNLATSVIKQALENVRYVDLKDWCFQVFGQSTLSKRKIVFSVSDDDTEFA